MKRCFIVTISLSLCLCAVPGSVLAQQAAAPIISGNVNGQCVSSGNAGDSTITCGDLRPAPGLTVITPAGVEKGPAAVELAPPPAPAPETEPAPADEPAPVNEPAPETTVASETDLDADNYPDALEVEAGLDPNNVDTDGDGVADGDEVNIYGTDPTVFDTDGDGVSDGGELFDRRTDPLVWDAFAVDSSNATTEEVVAAGDGAAPAVSSDDRDMDRLADTDEATAGTDPANPDSDGDGYYDGDEVNLGTDPLDPASVPAT
jgi:Bacterial TSP3 repeat